MSTVVLLLFWIHPGSAQNTRVDWYSLSAGYGGPGAGNTIVKSLIGQSFVGLTRYSSEYITSGFLTDTLFSRLVVAVEDQQRLPLSYCLEQNYPNPFNPSTTVHFEIPNGSHVTLKVYNVLGQEVMTLLNEERAAGRYDVRINASALSSGAYFYRLQAGAFVQTRKFLLIR